MEWEFFTVYLLDLQFPKINVFKINIIYLF